ncbi:MAG: hypothetical protein M1834_006211 [Cirrosporium novae-zelandiae]|nr:MAG: hypothetical protein M1834_006211 [Cirrosporium novae-zelandiae]
MSIGNHIHLAPLQLGELPYHPNLHDLQQKDKYIRTQFIPASNNGQDPCDELGRPHLRQFLVAILNEGVAFTDNYLYNDQFKRSKITSSPPSAAKVTLGSTSFSQEHLSSIKWEDQAPRTKPRKLQKERWFSRRSQHDDAQGPWTVDFAEFKIGLLQNHSESEKAYTPDVLDYADEIQSEGCSTISNYTEIGAQIMEMAHEIKNPGVDNRVFPELVITAQITPSSFIIIQIPVNISDLPVALYSNGKHLTQDRNTPEGQVIPQAKHKVVLGAYASVERVTQIQDPNNSSTKNDWAMATTSDARGYLPMFAQKLALPGAINKDVGLFVGWVCGRRGGGDGDNGGL